MGLLKLMQLEVSEQEKLILKVVEEYLNKNRYFDMTEILPFIMSRLRMTSSNLNMRRIEEILKILVKKKLIVEGSKLSVNDILGNQKRKEIYDYILQKPGVYFYKIIRELKLSNHVVTWHLNMLLKFNFIKKERFENRDLYFDSNYNESNPRFRYFTSKEKSRKIIIYLRNNDYGIAKTQLSKELNMHTTTISKYLKFLEEYGIIFKKKISKRIIYFLNEDFFESPLPFMNNKE